MVSFLGFIPAAASERSKGMRRIRFLIRAELKAQESALRATYLATVADINLATAAAYRARYFPADLAAAVAEKAAVEATLQAIGHELAVQRVVVEGIEAAGV
jgi:hypothetical protein